MNYPKKVGPGRSESRIILIIELFGIWHPRHLLSSNSSLNLKGLDLLVFAKVNHAITVHILFIIK